MSYHWTNQNVRMWCIQQARKWPVPAHEDATFDLIGRARMIEAYVLSAPMPEPGTQPTYEQVVSGYKPVSPQ